MTVKAKLLLGTSIQVLLVVLLSLFLVFTSERIERSNDNEARATKIVENITETRFVTFEYLLHNTERSFEQWQTKHESLKGLVTSMKSEKPAVRRMLDGILVDSRDVSSIFNRLTAVNASSALSPNDPVKAALSERLTTQLLVKQQSQISSAIAVAAIERKEAEALSRQANWLIGGTVMLLLAIAAFNVMFITRAITRALAGLLRGAAKIANGQLDYRVKIPSRRSEFGRLAMAFNSMASSLEQTDKVRSDFILIASHQLRTPLTALKWYTEELLYPTEPLTEARRKSYIRQISASNERMIALVDQLLIASKIGFGNLTLAPEMVAAAPILKDVMRDLSAQYRARKISLVHNVDKNVPPAWIDRTWLQLILQNLLTNAAKYSPPGSKVQVTLQKQDNHLLLSVADNGCGIPEHQKEHIFTRLFRADNARQIEGEGSGLGLYITKTMVERVHGKIWFESVENKGTTFYVQLRLKPEVAGGTKKPRQSGGRAAASSNSGSNG